MSNLTIDDLKKQRRWVLWRLETRDGKETKVPYQSNGHKAASDNPKTWLTHAEVTEHAHKFSGVGLVLGEVEGVHVSGVDLDKCYDPVQKRFTPESREIVIDLDSYTEFSPSGDGAHVLVVGDLRGRKGIKLPYLGCKAVELYDSLRYLTFTGRHIGKTPSELLERTVALNALYDRVLAAKPRKSGLSVTVSLSEWERPLGQCRSLSGFDWVKPFSATGSQSRGITVSYFTTDPRRPRGGRCRRCTSREKRWNVSFG